MQEQRHAYCDGGEFYGTRGEGLYLEFHNPYPKNWLQLYVVLKEHELKAYRKACKLARDLGFTSF